MNKNYKIKPNKLDKSKVPKKFIEISELWCEAYNDFCKNKINIKDFLQIEKIAKELLINKGDKRI